MCRMDKENVKSTQRKEHVKGINTQHKRRKRKKQNSYFFKMEMENQQGKVRRN